MLNSYIYQFEEKKLPDNYSLSYNNSQLCPYSLSYFFVLSFTYEERRKEIHNSAVTKSVFIELGVLSCLRQLFFSSQMPTLYKGLVHWCMEYTSMWLGLHSHTTSKQGRVKSYSFHQVPCLQSHYAAVLNITIYSTTIFMVTGLLNLLTACLPSSFNLAIRLSYSSLFCPLF